jgi:hypothetical protein
MAGSTVGVAAGALGLALAAPEKRLRLRLIYFCASRTALRVAAKNSGSARSA